MGKAQWCHVKSKKGRTPRKAASVHTEDNASETDMPTSQEFGYPTLIFTDPTHTAVMPHTDLEGEIIYNSKFLGRYCEYCIRRGETLCWCFSSDWEQGLDVSNPNPSVEKSSSSAGRKPPAGWSKSRHRVIMATNTTKAPSSKEEISPSSSTSMH